MKPMIVMGCLLFACSLYAQDNDALIKSCLSGNLAAVKQQAEGGANVNYKNTAGQTPLSVAYMWPEITSYLLGKGADANGGDYPALVGASRYYSLEVMKMLLKAGADANKVAEVKVDVAGPVRKALEDEKAKGKKANKYLVKAYEDQLKSMPPGNTMKFSALQNALAGTNCQECVALLLDAGADVEFKGAFGGNMVHEVAFTWISAEQRSANIQTNLPYFEQAGMMMPDWYKTMNISNMGSAYDIVRLLKNKGANMESMDNNKRTPLMSAVLQPNPNEEIINALVDNGADMKATGMNNELTDFAKETKDPEGIKVRFDFPREGRNANGSGYSANMDLVNPKPKRVALISYYLYDPGKGKTTGGAQSATVTASVWRTPNTVGQMQIDGFYAKSIDQLKASFKENGIDLLTPTEFLDTDEKMDFYFGFSQESAKKEKTAITKRNATGGFISQVATASVSTLKVSPFGKGYREFFIANEGDDESAIANFQGGVFSSNRKLTSSLGFELAKGLGVDAVVVVYICTRKVKENKDDFGVNAVVTMMLGPNPGRSEEADPEAKNLGQFYCGTRTYFSSPAIFKESKGIFGQYDGMANILKAHAAKMSKYINGKEKDE
ncbi:MAG: hypothetical protein JNK10_09360 [Cyclobacteriaceae bacterium]|nr:hypothetical protein [Cyclobacteriaceae bacterium]